MSSLDSLILLGPLGPHRMHWETSVYICLQAASSLNLPPGTAIPDFRSLARQAKRDLHQNGGGQRLSFPAQEVTVGHDDDDTIDDQTPFDPAREYGWDVEHPRRQLRVDAFEIEVLPISNGEYKTWLTETQQLSNKALIPSSWTDETGELCVKTLFGLVPLTLAEEWPVAASAEQLEKFAKVGILCSSKNRDRRRLTRNFLHSTGQRRTLADVRRAVGVQPAQP